MSRKQASAERSLIAKAGVADKVTFLEPDETMWIDVIQKMDCVYAELVEHQVELEAKNAALEEANDLIASVFASMTDCLAVYDRSGRIQRVNRALEGLSGKSEADLVGKSLAAIFTPESFPIVQGMLTEVRDGGPIADREVALLDGAGAPAYLALNCSARFDPKGRYIGGVMVGRPLGELKRAYKCLDAAHKELQEAQRHLIFSEKMAALGRLVAGVAHELNNPISFVFANMHALKKYGLRIRRYLEAVDEGLSPAELERLRKSLKIERILADIEPLVDGTLEGATRASEIVQDLRRFSSTQNEPPERFDLIRIIHTAANWVIKTARVKPAVAYHLPAECIVRTSRGPVHQILVNLLQNSIDAVEGAPEAGIEITLSRAGGMVAVAVRDHGPGISKAAMDRMFEPFFTTKPIGKGLGLGLYLSYGLAKDLGGDLTAANHNEGGAVFTLHIPEDVNAHGQER